MGALSGYLFSKKASWYLILVLFASVSALCFFSFMPDLLLVRPILSLILLFILPGYAFIKLLYPEKATVKMSSVDFDNIERIALSFGLSLALSSLVGLVLNYTPLGLRLGPLVFSLIALTMVLSTAAIIRDYGAFQREQQTDCCKTTMVFKGE
jgi:uncharacterized membrane protein